jgi:hypothetical protein
MAGQLLMPIPGNPGVPEQITQTMPQYIPK